MAVILARMALTVLVCIKIDYTYVSNLMVLLYFILINTVAGLYSIVTWCFFTMVAIVCLLLQLPLLHDQLFV